MFLVEILEFGASSVSLQMSLAAAFSFFGFFWLSVEAWDRNLNFNEKLESLDLNGEGEKKLEEEMEPENKTSFGTLNAIKLLKKQVSTNTGPRSAARYRNQFSQ